MARSRNTRRHRRKLKAPEIKQREPNGRHVRTRHAERARIEPTPERQRVREALLGSKPGCTDDWIDVAAAQDMLDETEAEALRRYRRLGQAYAKAIHSPRLAPDILAGLMPRSGGNPIEEEALIRIRGMFDDAQAELRRAPMKASKAVDRAVADVGMPMDLTWIKMGTVPLIEWFGL